MKKLYPTERQTQQAIIGYLRYKGWYTQRMNSGAIRTENRLIQLAEKGTPDIMAFKVGVAKEPYDLSYQQPPVAFVTLLFVEVKAHGNKPTLSQTEKMQELESFGARCIVAYSVADLEAAGI